MWLTPPIAVLAAAGIAFISGLTCGRLSYVWNERSKERDRQLAKDARPLELYKTVYPEMFKAARELMEVSARAYRQTHAFSGTLDVAGTGCESVNALRADLQNALFLAHSLQWLLGDAVLTPATDFRNAGDSVIHTIVAHKPPESLTAASERMEITYAALMQALRAELYIGDFYAVLHENTPMATLLKTIPDKPAITNETYTVRNTGI